LPYNSSSFERQLAKYKQEQAQKSVADLPRKKYETYSDPHQVKSRVNTDRGSIKSYALEPVQIMGEGAQTAPLLREAAVPIIIQSHKKPYYKRAWFLFLVLTTLPTLAMPVFYKEQWNEMKGMVSSVRETTGVDPMSASTYTHLFRNRNANAPDHGSALHTQQEDSASSMPQEHTLAPPADMGHAVEQAQERAEEITSQGAGYSMQYIELEARRLNDAAKKFDQQYKK